MPRQQGFAEVNGARLYYEMAGAGHPLALIHGFSLDSRMWDNQFEAFVQQYTVIRYDLRGFGRSAPVTGEPYSHAADLRALLAYLGIDQASVIGLSLGGGIAINFALTYPEATRALVVIDSVLEGFVQSEEWSASMAEVRAAAQERGIAAGKERWLRDPLFGAAAGRPEVASRLAEIVAGYSGWHWLHENPLQVLEPPAIERLDRIAVPTLVLVGEKDLTDFHLAGEILESGIPGARRVVIPGVGHMANMEAPQEFNRLVQDFLAGLSE